MSCAVAVSNTNTSNTSSPTYHNNPHYSLYSPSSSSSSSSFLSPLMLRRQQQEVAVPVCRTSALKKKRPAIKISIPEVLNFSNGCSGNLLVSETPKEKRVDEMEDDGEGYAVYSKRGRRAVLEDRFSAVLLEKTNHGDHGVDGNSEKALFGVFDGHGGKTAAEYAASNLGNNILDRLAAVPSTTNPCNSNMTKDAVRAGYLTTDKEFLKQNLDGGTCCVTAIIQQGNLIVSNVGDCRAVLSRNGIAEPLTIDQRASRQDEKSRIEANGGYVDCCNGVWRIQGSLAVSRAIGDQHLKEWIISEPETNVLKIQPDCQFLILASDGLWDKVSDQEAVDVVVPFCTNNDDDDGNKKPADLSRACRNLVELAVRRGSSDDTTVMVISLGLFADF